MLELAVSHPLKNFKLDVTLTMAREFVALFGPSGAGKSLTLQMIAGLVQPDAGYIRLNGRLVFSSQTGINLPPRQRRVGYVMQDYLLFPHLTVAQNIAYGLRQRDWSPQKKRRAVADMLDLTRLPEFAHHHPHELSGGQQQRVALARALIIQPDILLLDEPFSSLDGPTRAQLRQDLRELLRAVDRPALLVTHDLAEANILADRIAVYHQGRLLQMGPPAEIMARPATMQVAQLVGASNCFAGQVERVTAEEMWVRFGPICLRTPPSQFWVGQQVYGCIRPEQIILLRSAQKQNRYQNVVRGQIVAVMTDGLSFSLQLRLTGAAMDDKNAGPDQSVCSTAGEQAGLLFSEKRLRPDKPYDLVVNLPLHVFESLRPAVGELWSVSLKPTAIHLIEATSAG